jgi:hypothetical protein
MMKTTVVTLFVAYIFAGILALWLVDPRLTVQINRMELEIARRSRPVPIFWPAAFQITLTDHSRELWEKQERIMRDEVRRNVERLQKSESERSLMRPCTNAPVRTLSDLAGCR